MKIIRLDLYKEYFKALLLFWSSVSEGCSTELASTKITSPYLLLTDTNYSYHKLAPKASAKEHTPITSVFKEGRCLWQAISLNWGWNIPVSLSKPAH